MRKDELESKYDVKIVVDHRVGRSNFYNMYSADGSNWKNNLRSMIAVEAECKKHSDDLLKIKESVESI